MDNEELVVDNVLIGNYSLSITNSSLQTTSITPEDQR